MKNAQKPMLIFTHWFRYILSIFQNSNTNNRTFFIASAHHEMELWGGLILLHAQLEHISSCNVILLRQQRTRSFGYECRSRFICKWQIMVHLSLECLISHPFSKHDMTDYICKTQNTREWLDGVYDLGWAEFERMGTCLSHQEMMWHAKAKQRLCQILLIKS